MTKLATRFSNALAAGRKARENVLEPAHSANLNASYSAVISFAQTIEKTIDFVTEIREKYGVNCTVILITDRREIELYQLSGCIAEYLAPLPLLENHGSAKAAQIYQDQRMQTLAQKWQVLKWHALGDLAKLALDNARVNIRI